MSQFERDNEIQIALAEKLTFVDAAPGVSVAQTSGDGSGSGSGGSSSKPRSTGSSFAQPAPPVEVTLAEAYLAGDLAPEYETVLDFNYGWNARANLGRTLLPGMAVRFRVPAYSAGVIVGLAHSPAESGYADIEFGVLQRALSDVHIWDNEYVAADARVNLIRCGEVYLPEGWDPGAWNSSVLPGLDDGSWYDADMFPMLGNGLAFGTHEIRVYDDRLEYWVRWESAAPWMRIYTAESAASIWTVTAALYGGGDKVWGVEFDNESTFVRLPSLDVFASDVGDYTGADVRLPPPRMGGEDYIELTEADILTPALQVLGGDDVAWADMRLPSLAVQSSLANDAPLIDLTFGYTRLPKIRVQSLARDITFASAEFDVPKVVTFASDVADLTIGRPVLPGPVNVWSNDIADLRRVEMVEFAYAVHVVMGFEAVYVIWSERYGLIGAYTATEVEAAMIDAQMTASESLSANEIIRALMAATMTAADTAALLSEPLQVWAFHLDANGSTRYEDYRFNSFATIGGVTYGANDGGIYRLDGDTDDGVDIRSLVDFGSLSFGTNQRKAMPYVYVGMASGGKTYLKIESDDKAYIYEVRDNTPHMKTHRFEPGRGLRGSFYGFTLVSEGPAFDLHNIEFFPVPIQRRL